MNSSPPYIDFWMEEESLRLDLWPHMLATKSSFWIRRWIHAGINLSDPTSLFVLKGFVRVVTQDSLIKSPKVDTTVELMGLSCKIPQSDMTHKATCVYLGNVGQTAPKVGEVLRVSKIP
jgi:hypothetical protein